MLEIQCQEWKDLLKQECQSVWFKQLCEFVKQEYQEHTCYPPMLDILRALEYCPPSRLKAVILGQDPYHNKGQANGLCFSCLGDKLPPSLINIYKELEEEYPRIILNGGDLSSWAKQGVLLLNTCLTVREHEPNSHKDKGWELLTQAIINIANSKNGVVFMLWGAPAQKLVPINVRKTENLYLTCAHPSPLSAYRGFFGCNHFRACNEFLLKNNQNIIDWSVGV